MDSSKLLGHNKQAAEILRTSRHLEDAGQLTNATVAPYYTVGQKNRTVLFLQ